MAELTRLELAAQLQARDPQGWPLDEQAATALRAADAEIARLKEEKDELRQERNGWGDRCQEAEAALAETQRAIDEALMLTESCSSLKEMASACIEGAMWKNEAMKAQDALAEMRRIVDLARKVCDVCKWLPAEECEGKFDVGNELVSALARHLSSEQGE